MTETTSEQLAEIEGQGESAPATKYIPPDGWRVLQVGERLRFGDMTVRKDGYCYSTERVGYFVGANQRYIRPIEPEPQQPVPQAADTPATEYTPPDGWRVLKHGEVLQGGDEWVNWEGTESRPDILHGDGTTASGGRYIRRIKPEAQPEAQPEPVPDAEEKIRRLQAAINERAELRGGDQTRAELQARIRELEAIKDTQADTAATEYTPPDGYRVLQIGEVVQKDDIFLAVNGEQWPVKRIGETVVDGDVAVRRDGYRYPTERVGGWVGSNQGYIRPIEPEPQPESEPEPVQVREGRWRTRGGEEIPVTAMPTDHDDFAYAYPWWDGDVKTWANNGAFYKDGTAAEDLVEYLGPIEPQPDPEQIEELRSEVSYVQRLLGESNRKVAQLEDLVASLRTINEAQEKAFEAAGQHNGDLQSRLNAVCSEWSQQAETIRRLQIELDAAHQVPADSPELRQLRADLAEVTRERDQYLDSYERIFGDLETIRETTKAAAVEAIAEWLEPIRLVDSAYLANATMQHLPQIMRHLTGLDSHCD